MATSSIGTAWIQIKPTLKSVSSDIQKQLEQGGSDGGKAFNKGFSNAFLSSAKATFSSAFSEFSARSEAALNQFKTASMIGLTAVTIGIAAFAKQLDTASGSQKSFIANMELAGISNENTAKTFAMLQEYANKSIYSLTDMTSTAGILASTGVKNAGELVKAFGNMAAAADNPSQAIKSISQQMAQVNGKGFVQTMDFRIMQEQAAGPMKQVRDELMKLNNWSMAGFQDALSNGEISADMLNKAILKVGSNPILENLATQPRTIGDAWEALTSTIVSNLATSKTWADIQKRVVDMLMKAGEWVSNNQDAIEQWINEVITAGSNVAKFVADNKDLLIIIGKGVLAFKAFQIATGGVISIFKTFSPYIKFGQAAVLGIAGLIQKMTGFGSAAKSANDVAKGIENVSSAANKAPKTFAFGDSISSFFKNIGKALSGAVEAVMAPIKTLLTGVGQAIAGFFQAFANPAILAGALIFAVAAASVAAAILLVGGAVGIVTPGIASFMNTVLLPLGAFLAGVLIMTITTLTQSIIDLTNGAVIPLGLFLTGSLTATLDAIAAAIINVTNGAVIPLANAISGSLMSILYGAKDLIGQVGSTITNVLGSALNGIKGVIGAVGDAFTKMGGAIRTALDGVSGVLSAFKDIITAIGDAIIATVALATGRSIKYGAGFATVTGAATGGRVDGIGTATSDSNLYALSKGEYVIRAAAAQKIGYSNLDQLNSNGGIGSGQSFSFGDIIINGYDKDPRELAQVISNEIALSTKRVMA